VVRLIPKMIAEVKISFFIVVWFLLFYILLIGCSFGCVI